MSKYYRLEIQQIEKLFESVRSQVDYIVGPKLSQGAICLETVENFSELPRGFRDKQDAGSYNLEATNSDSLFQYSVGPNSLKKFLHPAKQKLWTASKNQLEDTDFHEEEAPTSRIAFFGMRSCDVKSLEILDRVFLESGFTNSQYEKQRKDVVLITASCAEPSSVCFCTSMDHGPKPQKFDLNIIEIYSESSHFFLLQVGSKIGEIIAGSINLEKASTEEIQQSEDSYLRAVQKIERTLETKDLKEKIQDNLESPQWDKIADKCLSCANCTMVCPTCFCSTSYDQSDLEGNHVERWLNWDSCFNNDFSYIHGGAVRSSTKSKYRQWLSHKFSSWFDQFGSSGCVGCGRCIAWCPVGIDLTVEIPKVTKQDSENI